MKEEHVKDLLPWLVNGTLEPKERASFENHLLVCAACRREARSWEMVSEGVRAQDVPPPSTRVLESVMEAIEVTPQQEEEAAGVTTSRLPLAGLWPLLRAQPRLIRSEVWVASALVTALGALVALFSVDPAATSLFLLLGPLVSGMGMAFVYGPENDPALETARATVTSPSRVLLARMLLVAGYNAALALPVCVLLAWGGGVSPWALISAWFAPFVALASVALLLSVVVGSTVASAVAALIGGLRSVALVAPFASPPGSGLLLNTWALVAVAVVLLFAAFVRVNRMEVR